MSLFRPLPSLFLGLLVYGCGEVEMPEVVKPQTCSGLNLTQVDHAVSPPANVASLIRVKQCDGQPLGVRLAPENFTIAEDGQVLSSFEALQEIRPTEREVSELTVIVLDLSGSIYRAGLKEKMIEGLQRLIDQIGPRWIAIYGFDGRPDLIPYANFTKDRDKLNAAMDRISKATLVDDSTNLYGAVINALEILDTAISTEIRTVTQVAHGTLVLFTDGVDRAQRVRGYSARMAVKYSPHSTFTIGVGEAVNAQILKELGQTGHMMVEDASQIAEAFEQVGREVAARALQDYVVSYCSPSRAGAHELTITVEVDGQVGRTHAKFYADKFGAGCDPSASLLR